MVWLEFKATEGDGQLYGKERRGEYYPQGWRFSTTNAVALDERKDGTTFATNSVSHHEDEVPIPQYAILFITSFFPLQCKHICLMLSKDGLYMLISFASGFISASRIRSYQTASSSSGTYWILKWDILNTESGSNWDILNTIPAKWELGVMVFLLTADITLFQAFTHVP